LDYITLNKERRNKEENEHKGKKEKYNKGNMSNNRWLVG
jgi:hypothetical protein